MDGARLWKAPIAGGTPSAIAPPAQCGAGSVTVDGDTVYFADGRLIERVSVEGCDLQTLFDAPENVTRIVVDGTNVYFAAGVIVGKVPVNGGAVTVLAAMASGDEPYDIALDATNVYWVCPQSGSVMTTPK